MNKVLYTILLMMWGLLAGACSDGGDADGTPEPGSLTLSLQSGDMVVSTRASESDPEYYMGSTYLFFYTDTTKSSVYARSLNAAAYNEKNIHWALSDATVATLFPGTKTECVVYAVCNVPTGSIAENTQYTLQELRAIGLSTNFSDELGAGDFAMDGMGVLTLDRTTMTMAGSVTLERALAKISMELSIANSIEVKDGETTVTYTPVLTSVSGGSALRSTMHNSVTNGVLNGSIAAGKRTYCNLSRTYSAYTITNALNLESTTYVQTPYYSYPNDWVVSYEESTEPYIKLEVAWQKQGENSYTTYYYQLPVNDTSLNLLRNHHYCIKLTVGMLGSTDPNNPLELESCDYEIQAWGYTTDENSNISASISDFHFLVTEDKEFSIWNEDGMTFSYNSCYTLEGVYLTAISYESTKHTDDNGNTQTVYLFKTTYDETTHTYSEVKSYTGNDATVRGEYVGVVNNINTMVANKTIVTHSWEKDGAGIPTGNGTVTLTAPIDQTASLVYRPITYTIVLVNSKDHQYLRQTVKITQYPSKYIEFAPGDNVFVNGYYARIEGNGTTQLSSTGLYQSYPFIYSGYVSSTGTNFTGYYSGTDYAATVLDYGYLSQSNMSGYISSYSAINASYEYIQGVLQTELDFVNTTDVYVTAFTKSDNTFTVTNASSGEQTYEYRLGDPRASSSFTADDHTSSSYSYTGNMLYDYYVMGLKRDSTITTTTIGGRYTAPKKAGFGGGSNPGGGSDSGGGTTSGSTTTTTTTYYNRYVKSWSDDAGKIKIGGTTTDYDKVIAPLYKVQSAYGALVSAAYFEVAKKRCATYQEAGYPAGRWRLPTLAEIAFIASLQKNEVIGALFVNNSTGYWTSSGGKLAITDSNTTIKYTSGYASSNTSGKCFVRCVYDLWYWQDGNNDAHQHLPVNEFHPYPTKH